MNQPMIGTNTGALRGLRVLDLSRFIAGPHCAMQLGDLGADVVKVERRKSGDDTRQVFPQIEGESLYFMIFNRNKRSLTLDFRNPEAQELLRELIKEADVLVENFRPGTMERMGCSWDEVHRLNPRLIMARISGYGQTGSMAAEPCFDGIAQANSGLMSITGYADGAPTVAGSFVVDYATALYTTIGIMGALQQRHQTGLGQLVDVSLMGAATSLLMTAIPEQLLLDQTMPRCGNQDRYSAPANVFKTADGKWLYMISGNDALFPRLAKIMGREDLLQDERFSTLRARLANRDAIESIVADWALNHPSTEIMAKLSQAEIPGSIVATLQDVARNDYLREAEHIVTVDHPVVGAFPMQGMPIRLSESPGSIRHAAPTLGQHSREVLREWLGKSDGQIQAMENAAVI
ncbi:Formyl-coenzyme A transferase [compost metagenome]